MKSNGADDGACTAILTQPADAASLFAPQSPSLLDQVPQPDWLVSDAGSQVPSSFGGNSPSALETSLTDTGLTQTATPNTTFPYNDVVLINSQFGNTWAAGSGVVIGPHTILTASHVVYDAASHASASNVYLYPGYSANNEFPEGSGNPVRGSETWHYYQVGNSDGTITNSDSQYDFCVIDTSYTFSSWFGVSLNFSSGTVHMTGYPASTNGRQDDRTGTVYKDSNFSVLDYGTIYSEHGNSGGPLWINSSSGPSVVGIVSSTVAGVQLTDQDWATIKQWVSADGYSLTGGTSTAFTDGNDNITLTQSGGTWHALGGDDVIVGTNGADKIYGDDGNDVIFGDQRRLSSHLGSIYRLYQVTLGREPDIAGVNAWSTQLDAGVSLQSIASGFVNSGEFQAKYGSLNNTQFVTLLYNNTLHRGPDAAGLNSWVNSLNAGASRESVVTGFSESGENQSNTAYEAAGFATGTLDPYYLGQVYRLYVATLNRTPDLPGFASWTDSLASGNTLNNIVSGFVTSGEFQARYGSLNNSQFVTLLYNNVLRRNPDASGLNGWVNTLNGGASRESVVLGFSESAEMIATTQPQLAAYIKSNASGWSDFLDGGTGTNWLIAGLGADTFQLRATDRATDHIYGSNAWDSIVLSGFGYGNVSFAMQHMTQSGQDVLFSDSRFGFQATFHHTTLSVVNSMLTNGLVTT